LDLDGVGSEARLPSHLLLHGRFYEFRLGYRFPSYTYFSNVITIQTLSNSSLLVAKLHASTTNQSALITWAPPEYIADVVGYHVFVSFLASGSAGASTIGDFASIGFSESIFLPLMQNSIFIGCLDNTLDGSQCLSPFSSYLIRVAVITSKAPQKPSSLVFTTKATVTPTERFDEASFYALAGLITLTFVAEMPVIADTTPIAASFLNQSVIVSQDGGFRLALLSATVRSRSSTVINVHLSLAEMNHTISYIYNASQSYSPLSLKYSGRALLLKPQCLLICVTFKFLILI
jgi:hypothetical protein